MACLEGQRRRRARDGVYLLPNNKECLDALSAVERDILSINGTAFLLPVDDPQGSRFVELFDRSEDYARLRVEIEACQAQLTPDNALASTKQVRKLRKAFAQITSIDFFPTAIRQQSDSALEALELSISRALSQDEPSSRDHPIEQLEQRGPLANELNDLRAWPSVIDGQARITTFNRTYDHWV